MISEDLRKTFPEIYHLENAHLWAITADMLVFSAHAVLKEKNASCEACGRFLKRVNRHLREQYGIIESTLQIVSR